MDRRKIFLAIVQFHKMSQTSQKMSHLWYFQWGKWIMDYGIFRLGQTLTPVAGLYLTRIGFEKIFKTQRFFWFLVCNTATQLATQLPQRRIRVVRSNKVARKRLTESNGTPAMDLGPKNIFWHTHSHIIFICEHSHTQTYKQTRVKTKYKSTMIIVD